MWIISWSVVVVCWFAWLYPFLFRAPHKQERESITVAGPTRAGLLLECLGIFAAFLFRMPVDSPVALWRVAAAVALGVGSAVMAWTAVTHLGRQFRIQAGLYHDHQLVNSGPYRLVRHPIYASLLGMLLCTILLMTTWEGAIVSLVLYVAGTEIRVRTEDALLASRFADEFRKYQRSVPAYIPYVR